MLMGNFITEERLFMEIRQGYSYHIKDEFFDLFQDKYLMSNKEQLWKKSWKSRKTSLLMGISSDVFFLFIGFFNSIQMFL